MTPTELLQLIQSDPTAMALATAGNDEACAIRCREIAPKELRDTLLTELDIIRIIPDPVEAEHLLNHCESVASSNPIVHRIWKWLEPGSPGINFADQRVRAMLTTDPRDGGIGLTPIEAAPLLEAAEYVPSITAADVGAAMASQRIS